MWHGTRIPRRLAEVALTAAAVAACGVASVTGQDRRPAPESARLPLDHPAIEFLGPTSANPVASLMERLERGDAVLAFREDGTGYLEALLDALDVPRASVSVVYSKTSFQTALISADTPRRIYFNDDVAVGFVPGGDIEITTVDDRRGLAFYSLPARRLEPVRLTRPSHCLECHYGPATSGVPGLVVRSVDPAAPGLLEAGRRAVIVDHRTPLTDRWGGWSLTGAPGRSVELEHAGDPVALLTLEHQARTTNLITRLAWETRIEKDAGHLGYTLAERMTPRVDDVLGALLFVDEAPLDGTLVAAADSDFAIGFARRGPHDRYGRTLRDVDLEARLFRHPLSYLIYSRALDAVEPVVREYLWRRLYDVLTGEDTRPRYRHLSDGDRAAILDILRDTRPYLPAYWRPRDPGLLGR